jgi:hypothetical protein
MRLTLPKVGTWSPPGLPKFQGSTAEGKTPRLEVFFIPLERPWSVDVENGLAWAIWTSTAQVMVERRARSQTDNLTPDHKKSGMTQPRGVQRECDTPLESYWGELQDCFRPHPNPRSEPGVTSSQNPKSPNRDSFETPPWESREKKPFRSERHGAMERILYGGRWWLPPSPGRGESSESRLPVACPNTKSVPNEY